MTRARDIANLGSQAGSGLDASDITTGTFPDTVTLKSSPLSNRNIIINGGMQISQRATSATGVGASSNVFPTVDRWKVYAGNTAGRLTMSQSTDAPDGFGNSVKFDCTTEDTSTAVNEEFIVTQPIEGYNLQQMAKGTSGAKAVTLSFYAKGTAKTYGWEFVDHDTSGQRHIANTFTVTTSWQRFSFVIPADTTGAFGNDANASASLYFWLLAGDNMTSGTKATAWQALAATERAVGIDNFFSSDSNELFITGVQLELGSNATPFEYLTYADNLRNCRRYFWAPLPKSQAQRNYIGHGFYLGGTKVAMWVNHPVTMRTTPTLEMGGGTDTWIIYRNGAADAFDTFGMITHADSLHGRDAVLLERTSNVSGTGGDAGVISGSDSTTYMYMNAEL